MTLVSLPPAVVDVFVHEDFWRLVPRSARARTRPRRRVLLHHSWTLRKTPHPSCQTAYFVAFLQALESDEALARVRRLNASQKRFLLFLGDRPPEAVSQWIVRLNIRDDRRFHVVGRRGATSISKYLSRLVDVLETPDAERAIIDAWFEGDSLVALSPTFERLRVPIALLPKLGRATREELGDFELDEFGDFIYWPSHDVHLGWCELWQAVDPQARLRAEQQRADFNRRYGDAIRRLREQAGLTQAEIADLSERTVRRIEQGETRATLSAIMKLAKAHRLSPNEYMQQLAQAMEP